VTAPRAPAGHYPVNLLFPWVTMAGSSIACGACSTEGRLPLPRDLGYSAAVEAFAEGHRLCSAAGEGRKP
jgi:hypothetical protein